MTADAKEEGARLAERFNFRDALLATLERRMLDEDWVKDEARELWTRTDSLLDVSDRVTFDFLKAGVHRFMNTNFMKSDACETVLQTPVFMEQSVSYVYDLITAQLDKEKQHAEL